MLLPRGFCAEKTFEDVKVELITEEHRDSGLEETLIPFLGKTSLENKRN